MRNAGEVTIGKTNPRLIFDLAIHFRTIYRFKRFYESHGDTRLLIEFNCIKLYLLPRPEIFKSDLFISFWISLWPIRVFSWVVPKSYKSYSLWTKFWRSKDSLRLISPGNIYIGWIPGGTHFWKKWINLRRFAFWSTFAFERLIHFSRNPLQIYLHHFKELSHQQKCP